VFRLAAVACTNHRGVGLEGPEGASKAIVSLLSDVAVLSEQYPCDREGFDGMAGVRRHHVQTHGESLPNRTCEDCGTTFYDENAMRSLCEDCHREWRGPGPKRDDVEIPDGETWASLSSYQRYYYRNRAEERARTSRRPTALREWYRSLKEGRECREYGESRPPALDFHHDEGTKTMSISEMVAQGYGRDRIRAEIRKCSVLCANCHRVRHADARGGGGDRHLSASRHNG